MSDERTAKRWSAAAPVTVAPLSITYKRFIDIFAGRGFTTACEFARVLQLAGLPGKEIRIQRNHYVRVFEVVTRIEIFSECEPRSGAAVVTIHRRVLMAARRRIFRQELSKKIGKSRRGYGLGQYAQSFTFVGVKGSHGLGESSDKPSQVAICPFWLMVCARSGS